LPFLTTGNGIAKAQLVDEMPGMPGVDTAKASNGTKRSEAKIPLDDIFGMPVHEGGVDGNHPP
jgi:hypothetical protein